VIKELDQFMSGQTPATCKESWDLNLERYKYQQEAQQHWNDTVNPTSTGRPIDAYISPVAVSAAVKPGGWVSIGSGPSNFLLISRLYSQHQLVGLLCLRRACYFCQ